ncbi:conserved unknown protein [Ectocarpus siliculosus]|uniref:AB hydrolase-1 domain-containing protein n=1 Tax=Ectocarpus siliculosus TaxID=2880 RepID=D7FNQ6_ECTSI|nr:conserved unknown protein [Ectocarpus siliculosus]|eukprot:CBJ26067.1 conserved unknown protein [Ectocarpus siliculosus]
MRLLSAFALVLVAVAPFSQSFIVYPSSSTQHAPISGGTMSSTSTSSSAVQPAGEAGAVTVPGKSQLVVRNEEEGYDLNGVLTVKREDSKSVWVLCHGLCSSCEGTVPAFVSRELSENTYRFDFAGCGQSGGDWRYAGYDKELGDLRAVVLRLRELGWNVDCVLGHSKGAAAVLRYGETFDDVPLVVNVAGRFDTSETPRSRFTEEQWNQLEETGSFEWNVRGEDLTINKSDFEERAALNMKKTAASITRSKVLTIHGTEDETIPVADAYEFDKVLPNNELVVVEGATHRFATEPEQVEVMKALNRYLEKAEEPSTAER